MKNKILKIDDIKGNVYEIDEWKDQQAPELQHFFNEKIKEIKSLYDDLLENYKWNKIIYDSEIMFVPVLGKKYYLYENKKGKNFLSLIAPDEWSNNLNDSIDFIGSFKQDSNLRWNAVYIEKVLTD